MACDWSARAGSEAADYYRDILKTSGFQALCQSHIFEKVAARLNYEFCAFKVEEVGYKLSKRKERARPNQLCLFQSRGSKELVTNLHLAGDECITLISKGAPQTVLDEIRRHVKWEVG